MRINSRLLVLMARSLYPKEPALDAAETSAVEETVVRYLADQITAMPAYTRIPYLFGMRVFNYASILRFGLPFTRIAPARQNRYIRSWSRSPIGLMRDFIKLIRSCLLLAYLDHPLVLKGLDDNIRRGGSARPT